MDGRLGLALLGVQFCAVAFTLLHIWRFRSWQQRSAKLFAMLIDDGYDKLAKYVADYKRSVEGRLDKVHIEAKIAEKMGEKAFSLANSANIASVAVQRALFSKPRLPTREAIQRDILARKQVAETLGSELGYLEPVLSDEDLDLIDKAREHYSKFNGKQ